MNNFEQRQLNTELYTDLCKDLSPSTLKNFASANFVSYNDKPYLRVNSAAVPVLLVSEYDKLISFNDLELATIKVMSGFEGETIPLDHAVVNFATTYDPMLLIKSLSSILSGISSMSYVDITAEAMAAATVINRATQLQHTYFGQTNESDLFLMVNNDILKFVKGQNTFLQHTVDPDTVLGNSVTLDSIRLQPMTIKLLNAWNRIFNIGRLKMWLLPNDARVEYDADMLNLIVSYITGAHMDGIIDIDMMGQQLKDTKYLLKDNKLFAIRNDVRFNGKKEKHITAEWVEKNQTAGKLTALIDVFDVTRTNSIVMYGFFQQLIAKGVVNLDYETALRATSFAYTGAHVTYMLENGEAVYALDNLESNCFYYVDSEGLLHHVVKGQEEVEECRFHDVVTLPNGLVTISEFLLDAVTHGRPNIDGFDLPGDISRVLACAAW